MAAEFPNPFELRSTSELNIQVPSAKAYSSLRTKWKSNDLAGFPLKGIRMLDDDHGTYNSLVTIKFVCKPLAYDEPQPYQGQLDEAILCDGNNQPYGFIAEYSYSFYPDPQSKRAKDIGYLRYDFHPHVMGDGDRGGHPYFHCHVGCSGREFEEIELEEEIRRAPRKRSLELEAQVANLVSELRLPTGLTMPEAFISTLEYHLAPKSRKNRIDQAISNLDWYYLMLDLTPQALRSRLIQRYGKAEAQKLIKSDQCQSSMKRAAWHNAMFDSD